MNDLLCCRCMWSVENLPHQKRFQGSPDHTRDGVDFHVPHHVVTIWSWNWTNKLSFNIHQKVIIICNTHAAHWKPFAAVGLTYWRCCHKCSSARHRCRCDCRTVPGSCCPRTSWGIWSWGRRPPDVRRRCETRPGTSYWVTPWRFPSEIGSRFVDRSSFSYWPAVGITRFCHLNQSQVGMIDMHS